MKAPNRFIKISQSPTTIVYSLYGNGTSRAVIVTHRAIKPAVFRIVGRKFDF